MKHDSRRLDRKIARLLTGAKPRLLELCSGCGGMSLGLQSAGFDLSAQIESDIVANTSHAINFAPAKGKSYDAWIKPRNMITSSLEDIIQEFELSGSATQAFDVVAAGLPCQAFARIGRSKLRSVTGDKHAFKNDARALLYQRFLQFIEQAQPLAVILENVPDILNFGGHNVPEEISTTLDALGYESRYTLLNGAFYGVPQLRERLFLLAVSKRLGVVPTFPEPTHTIELPRGYEGSRSVALKHVQREASHFSEIPKPRRGLPDAVSAEDALADLPFISEHLRDASVIGRRKVTDRLPYRQDCDPSAYALAMRSWKGFEADGYVDGHVVRLTARDFPIFGRMPRGGDYPVALRVAHGLLEARLKSLQKRSGRPSRNSATYRKLVALTVPPYDVTKFPNRWWKIDPSAPARTLTAHIGKDTYSHIHYDGRQKRTISVREAARLQSFPDGFLFAGAMNASFRQIGNAVPPVLALAVAGAMMKTLLDAAAATRKPKRLAAA